VNRVFFFCFSIFAVSKVWQFFPLATFSGFTLKLQKFPITFKKIHGHIAKMHPKIHGHIAKMHPKIHGHIAKMHPKRKQ
jgi:hypothetical protein